VYEIPVEGLHEAERRREREEDEDVSVSRRQPCTAKHASIAMIDLIKCSDLIKNAE